MKEKYTYDKIVQNLKELRKKLKISQNDVAEELNKFPSYISKIENGKRRLDILEFIELLAIYNIDIDEFLENLKQE